MKRIALLLLLAACSSDPPVTPIDDAGAIDASTDAGVDAEAGPATASWRPVIEHLDGAVLSIWGNSEKDIWAVGGAIGNGQDALAVRFDGTTWKRATPGGKDTFWWVHGTSANDVWLVGEKGRITHWDGSKFEERVSGTTATLYGAFAFAPNDVWAVGGTPESPDSPNDVVLHWDGTSWMPEAVPTPTKTAFFKVWGIGQDLWVVGEAGVIWHRASGTWTREGMGVANGRLTTITGCSKTELYAVGGRNLLIYDGTTWTKSTEPLVNDVNGVSCGTSPYGNVEIVGGGSLKLRKVGNAFVSDFGSKPFVDLHGAWIDPTGAMWGVGGQFNAAASANATRDGVIARYGSDTVPTNAL